MLGGAPFTVEVEQDKVEDKQDGADQWYDGEGAGAAGAGRVRLTRLLLFHLGNSLAFGHEKFIDRLNMMIGWSVSRHLA